MRPVQAQKKPNLPQGQQSKKQLHLTEKKIPMLLRETRGSQKQKMQNPEKGKPLQQEKRPLQPRLSRPGRKSSPEKKLFLSGQQTQRQRKN